MADAPPADPKAMITRRVVLTLPGMDDVDVRRGIEYCRTDGGSLHFDLYRPAARHGSAVPVVILVLGYSDLGARALLGCNLKDVASYDCWARLLACSGLAAVIYETHRPVEDLAALHDHLVADADALGIDANRVGIWSCSGNVPNAIGFLAADRPAVRCAALCYGYALDALPPIPILLARAGADALPGLNDSLVAFRRAAGARGLPVRLIDHPTGPHAFDIFDDSETSRTTIREILDFLRAGLDG